jgi:drug/metabolite transporter (DMT)-like permease
MWGFSGACSQFLFAHYDISPLFMTLIRTLCAGIVFMVVLGIGKRKVLVEMLRSGKTVGSLFIFGGAGLLTSQLSYVISVSYTNAGTATVLQSVSIVFVMLATCVMMRRAPTRWELLGLLCAVLATFLIATKGDVGTLVLPLAGLVWGIVNAITVAFYVMYPKRMFERFGSFAVTGCGMMAGGLVMLVLWLVLAAASSAAGGTSPISQLVQAQVFVPHLDAIGIVVLIVFIFIGTLGAFSLYLHGVSIVGGVNGSLLGAAEPASATLFASLWLGTAFSWGDWVGLVLMIATIALVSIRPSRTVDG